MLESWSSGKFRSPSIKNCPENALIFFYTLTIHHRIRGMDDGKWIMSLKNLVRRTSSICSRTELGFVGGRERTTSKRTGGLHPLNGTLGIIPERSLSFSHPVHRLLWRISHREVKDDFITYICVYVYIILKICQDYRDEDLPCLWERLIWWLSEKRKKENEKTKQ